METTNIVDFARRDGMTDALTDLLRTGAKQLIATAVEAELASYLAQFADLRTEAGHAVVVRNGHHPARSVQTGIGPVSVRIPKVRSKDGTPVTFRSALVPPYVRRTKTLEAALPWLYLKGISSGEMSAALKVLLGPDAAGLSANTVSRLKRDWAKEYDGWREAELDDEPLVYIWADGVHSGLRGEDDKLCALVIVGVTARGKKRFLAIEDGVRESTQSWREVLLSLKSRVTFQTNSAAIQPTEAEQLRKIGLLMVDFIAGNPREVFLIEGYTDAVGDESYNLLLSDRRAETVALALSEYFGVPPENLVAQGYGERFPLVPTLEAERLNRRVAVRRITGLIQPK